MNRIWIFFLLCLFILCGCSNDNMQSEIENTRTITNESILSSDNVDYTDSILEETSSDIVLPSAVNEPLLENLWIDTDIEVDLEAIRTANIYKWETEEINQTAIINCFVRNRTEIDRQLFNQGLGIVIEYSDRSFLSVNNCTEGNTSIYFSTELSQKIRYLATWEPLHLRYNINNYPQNTDLTFMPVLDVVARAENDLHAFGVENLEIFAVFALDHKLLEKQQQEYLDLGMFEPSIRFEDNSPWIWTQEDDAYLLIFRSSAINEIAVYDRVFLDLFSGATVDGSIITAIYSKNGCEYLEVENSLKSDLQVVSSHELVSGNEAINFVKNRFGDLITDSSYTITSIDLRYLRKVTLDEVQMLIPVWIFLVDEKMVVSNRGDNQLQEAITTHIVLVDATTGSELM